MGRKFFYFVFLLSFLKISAFEQKIYNIPSDSFKNISDLLDYASENDLKDIKINIISNLEYDSIVINEPIKKLVIFGMNTPSNCDLDGSVIINRSEDVTVQMENLTFKSFINQGGIDYFAMFFCMCENLVNEKLVKFSDIFGCEISNSFKWLSNGYLAASQGKYVGTNFWGIKSLLHETDGDSFIIYGNKKQNILILKEKDDIHNLLQMEGGIIAKDRYIAKNFVDSSIYAASFMQINGEMKVKSEKDSIFFKKEDGSFTVSGNLNVGKEISVGNKVKLNLSGDGILSFVSSIRDTIKFKDNRLDMKNVKLYTSEIYTKNLTNFLDQPLIFRYNNGKNQNIRWGFSNLDKINDLSLFEDSSNNIIFRRNIFVDPNLPFLEVNLNTPLKIFTLNENSSKKNIFKNFNFQKVVLENNSEYFKVSEKDVSSLYFLKSGFYNISYKVTFSSKKEKTDLFLRVKIDGREVAHLNSGYKGTIERGNFINLSGNGIVKIEKGDILTFEYFTDDDSLYFGNFDIFENREGVFLSILKIN